MKKNIISLCFKILFIFCFGCVPYIHQDEYGVERREESNLETEFGTIHIQLLFQKSSIRETWTAEDMSMMVYAFLIQAEQRYDITEETIRLLSDITVLIVRENSSLWSEICLDEYGDFWTVYGCSSSAGFIAESGEWQIVLREAIYTNPNRLDIFSHEIAHGFLLGQFNNWDNKHRAPFIWEDAQPSLVLDATHRMNEMLEN